MAELLRGGTTRGGGRGYRYGSSHTGFCYWIGAASEVNLLREGAELLYITSWFRLLVVHVASRAIVSLFAKHKGFESR
jgi:hypothetical protein